jgi:2-iminobutanoate/2-iminopropanoate deaminase
VRSLRAGLLPRKEVALMSDQIAPLTPGGMGKLTGQYSYSAGIVAGDWIFIAGQVPLDENDELVGPGDIGAQTRQALKRVEMVLNEAGATMQDVVSATAFVTTYDNLEAYDHAWSEAFEGHKPARATIKAGGLFRDDWLIEVQATAYKPRD